MLLGLLCTAAIAVALTGGTAAQGTSPSAKPSGRAERTVSTRATVADIDQATRTVVLKRDDGSTVTAHVDERVKNLPQVKVGDQVRITYREAIAYQVQPAGAALPQATAKGALTTAKPGEKPGGTATREVTLVATVAGIDKPRSEVTLRSPDGEVTTIKVRDPSKLDRVNVGDQVQVNYTEALALAVVPGGQPAAGSSSRSGQRETATSLNRQELERLQGGR